MGLFGDAHGGGGPKRPFSLKSVTPSLQWQDLAKLYLTQGKTNNIWIMRQTPWVLLTSTFFHRKSTNFATSEKGNIDCILEYHF